MIKGLSARVVLALAVSGAVVTGCTTQEPGDPTPGGAGTTTSTRTAETTGTKPSNGGESLADLDSCELLDSVSAQLNLTNIEDDGGGLCTADFNSTVSFSVKAHPELGLADVVPGGQQSETEVGSRAAKLVKESTSKTSCLMAIEVTDTSRVDVAASAYSSLDEACDAATRVANAIEPKLPK